MKDTSLLDTTAAAGKYAISVSGNQWWLCYTLDAGDTKLSNILANKAVQEGFRQSAVDNDEVPDTSEGAEADATVTNIYEASGTAIYLRVR